MTTLDDIAQARLRTQRLLGPPFARPADVVRALGAVQAQDFAGAKWALGQRLDGCVDSDVERAFGEGRILRTHVLRPTWHFVVPEDLRWMAALSAPRIRAAMAPYDRKMALTEGVFGRAAEVIATALTGGHHLTREELGEALGRAGIEAAGQRLGHLMMRAEVDAVVCSGPRRGNRFTYALVDERAPRARARTFTREEALGELAARYFTGHGPALPQDFGWWAGLTVGDARRGLAVAADRLASVTVEGQVYWHGPSSAPERPKARAASRAGGGTPEFHLLPNYDEYLIAYKDRNAVTDRSVLPSSPGARVEIFANHLVLRNGRLIGGWRRLLEKKVVVVETRLLVRLSASEREALARAAERLAAFLEQPVVMRAARGT